MMDWKIRVYRDDLIASGVILSSNKTGAVIKYVEKPVSTLFLLES